MRDIFERVVNATSNFQKVLYLGTDKSPKDRTIKDKGSNLRVISFVVS